MKKLSFIFILQLLIMLSACQTKDTWSADQKSAFYDLCYSGIENNFEPAQAEEYCNCMLETVMDKSPDPESVDEISLEDMQLYAKDCI